MKSMKSKSSLKTMIELKKHQMSVKYVLDHDCQINAESCNPTISQSFTFFFVTVRKVCNQCEHFCVLPFTQAEGS